MDASNSQHPLGPIKYGECTLPDVTVIERYTEMSDGVALKVIDFTPSEDKPEKPIVVFVAGWISMISGWEAVLKKLTPRFRTLYVETREKQSARLPQRDSTSLDFSISRMSWDLHELLEAWVPPSRQFCFVGSSLGSTTILEYLSRNLRQSRLALVIAPNCEFHIPRWLFPIARFIPPATYGAIKEIVKWYLRTFLIDRKKEPEQLKKYEGTLNAADPAKLKASAIKMKGYSLWPKLRKITAPIIIIGAQTDRLHGVGEIEKMASLMPTARLEIMESNRETHSEKAGIFIVDQIAGLTFP